ncbi:TonB-dependent receptor, putative [Acidisarcina polymorpha]|uniref:TonB-dependent receptor, putative n=1 Tax=Acidisarcina polymorpha TaxID=2211140 RepID=A0A2Z5G7D4_9BACT|nr:TonB-dependent receptor plug domain-containing protein [Acidisarcina polymorpha]AXC14880.1 TonB-dependent receptor, putative [Acidisarcina polymorpha]
MRVRRGKISRIDLFACFLMLLTYSGYAAAAIVHGTVTDPLGAAVAGAAVALVQNGKVVTNTHTDIAGGFTLSCGSGGRFYVLAGGRSFRQVTSTGFYAGRLDSVEQNVVLEPDPVRQNVVVTATGLSTPQAQTSSAVTVLQAGDLENRFTLIDALRQVAGLNVVSNGQNGSVTSIFSRGGNSDANKVLIDGAPAEDIGGRFDLGNVSTTGIASVEAFRGPDSVLYGSDAEAGVLSITTPSGSTPTPSFFYQGDAGNYYTYRNEFQTGGTRNKVDYYGAFSRMNSSNDIAMDQYHNVASSLNLGWFPTANTQIRSTARNTTAAVGLPGAYNFFLIPNDGKQSDQNLYSSTVVDNQTSENWHNTVRYALARKREQSAQWYPAGIPIVTEQFGAPTLNYYGEPAEIKGANGFFVSGRAQLNSGFATYPNSADSASNRDQVSGQTNYRLTGHLTALGGFRYEDERGSSNYSTYHLRQSLERSNFDYTTQLVGDFRNRMFYQLGGGIQKNHLYGLEGTPRASLVYYLRRPGAGTIQGTKLNFSFAQGVREPSLPEQFNSLYGILVGKPGGPEAIAQDKIAQIGAERTRTYDGGVEQSLLNEKMLVRGTYFHNEFGNQIEFIDPFALPQLLPTLTPAEQQGLITVLQNTGGAYANSLDFKAQGFESEIQYQPVAHLFLRGGYTYLDAKVQRSFSSDALSPSFNTGLPGGAPPSFANIPIGSISPLVGARPFRRPPHSGFLTATYIRSNLTATVMSAYSSRSDDSTFLGGYDLAAGNSLLLPNRNLDYGYQKVDVGLTYRVSSWLSIYTQTNNILNQSHIAPIGYPSQPLTVQSGVKVAIGGHSKQ